MKRYLMELLGALFLTVAVSFTGNPIAIGLMFMAMIYVGAHISGGHYNPAISLSAWLRGALRTEDLFIYAGAQTAGACIAIWLFRSITHNVFTPDSSPEVALWISVLMEALLTGLLCVVFLTVTMLSRFDRSAIYGAAIGLALVAITFVGGVFNPAVSLGSLLCNMAVGGVTTPSTDYLLIYILGPLLGGGIAAYTYDYLNPER